MVKIVINDLETSQDLDKQKMQNTVGGSGGVEWAMGVANTLMFKQLFPPAEDGGCHPDDSGSSGGDGTCSNNHNGVKYPQ